MHGYEQSLYRFKALRDKNIHHGVIETDLPFLFSNENNDTGILLLHGSEATPCNTCKLGELLSEKGYTTLGILLHGHGINPEFLRNGNVTWRDCYNSAIEGINILEGLVKKIYIVGSSFGGSIAYLLGIEKEDKISGIIAISSPSYSRHEIPDFYHWFKQIQSSMKAVDHNIHNLDIPVLIMHSIDDIVVKPKHAFSAFDKVKTEQKKMILYNKVGHSLGFGFNTNEVAQDIDNFIQNYRKPKPVRFELDFQNAENVNLAGDFNNWSAKNNPMFYYNGKWILDLFLAPGEYQYKFVINYNKWILDPKGKRKIAPKGEVNSLIWVD